MKLIAQAQNVVLLAFMILCRLTSLAQAPADTATLKAQLETILDRDQKTRTRGDSSAHMAFIDSTNLVYIEALISRCGWPGQSFVGVRGNYTVFLVVQHADLATQEKYLPLLERSVADSQSRACDLALLTDRVLMRQGKKQRYGSQVVPDPATGNIKFHPIEDETNVNARRKAVGLEPIETYASRFGIRYQPPDK